MVARAGGVNDAVIGVGLVMVAPSAGVAALMDGPACCAVPPPLPMKTWLVAEALPPPPVVAETVIAYVPLARPFGSKVARVAGGAPVPEARVTTVPEGMVCEVTAHEAM